MKLKWKSAPGGWLTTTLPVLLSLSYHFGLYVEDSLCCCCCFCGCFWPCLWQWHLEFFFLGRGVYIMVQLSVHICYWCWWRCWCWDWCGATYSHVNDTAGAHWWSWSTKTKRYRLFYVLSFYHALQLPTLLQHVSNVSFSSTAANYQQHYINKISIQFT